MYFYVVPDFCWVNIASFLKTVLFYSLPSFPPSPCSSSSARFGLPFGVGLSLEGKAYLLLLDRRLARGRESHRFLYITFLCSCRSLLKSVSRNLQCDLKLLRYANMLLDIFAAHGKNLRGSLQLRICDYSRFFILDSRRATVARQD